MTKDQEIAEEIRNQLGRNKFATMTGAKNFVAIDKGLRFDLPSRFAKDGINRISVVLDPSDTYTVKFYRVGPRPNYKVTLIAENSDVYNDNLRDIFEHRTGLKTSLGTMGREAEKDEGFVRIAHDVVKENKWARMKHHGSLYVVEASGPHGWIPQSGFETREKAEDIYKFLSEGHADALMSKRQGELAKSPRHEKLRAEAKAARKKRGRQPPFQSVSRMRR